MNHGVRTEIIRVAELLGIQMVSMDEEASIQMRRHLAERYAADPTRWLTYENLRDEAAVVCSNDAWRWLGEAISDGTVLFFVNPDEALTIWTLDSVGALTRLLSGALGFPFYVATPDLHAFICVDDHNCLIGMGAAKAGVAALRARSS